MNVDIRSECDRYSAESSPISFNKNLDMIKCKGLNVSYKNLSI
jgi:hypothetical protein